MRQTQSILILTSEYEPFKGGIGTYAREMAVAAVELGYQVTLVAPDYGQDNSEADTKMPFRTRRFRGGRNSPIGILMKVVLVFWLSLTKRYDIVHAVDWPFYIPLTLSLFRWRSRAVVTFHGTEINILASGLRRRVMDLLGFWSGWALFVGNSRFTANHLTETFPCVDPTRVRAIGLGVRQPSDLPSPSREEARASLRLGKDRFVILTLGRVVERKGQLVLAQALAALPSEAQRRIDWFIVGPPINPQYNARLADLCQTLDVVSHITGSLPDADLEVVLRAADVFCLPGLWDDRGQFEGFGLVYLEAGLRGVPSVATRTGGVPDAVVDGVSGILLEPGDLSGLTETIQRLISDSALRARLAQGATEVALAASWTRVASATYHPSDF